MLYLCCTTIIRFAVPVQVINQITRQLLFKAMESKLLEVIFLNKFTK
jgi:hypothetical protein